MTVLIVFLIILSIAAKAWWIFGLILVLLLLRAWHRHDQGAAQRRRLNELNRHRYERRLTQRIARRQRAIALQDKKLGLGSQYLSEVNAETLERLADRRR